MLDGLEEEENREDEGLPRKAGTGELLQGPVEDSVEGAVVLVEVEDLLVGFSEASLLVGPVAGL